jgi:hypothetical protein
MIENTSSNKLMTDSTGQRLRSLRNSLLRLHKLLLDAESNAYQQAHGQVTKGYLFQLVINHEWFAWLRPMSGLVAQIDEMFASDEPITEADATDLLNRVRKLIRPSETGVGFERKYFDALQRDPDVILTHAEISRLLVTDRK